MSDSILRFGYATDFAPFTFATDSGARGRLIEIVEAALSCTRFRAEFTPVTDGEVSARLEEGSLDAFVPAAISPSRRRQLRFSHALAVTGGAWFMARPAAVAAAKGPDASVPTPRLPGPHASAVIATPASGPLVPIIRKKYPQLKILEVPNYRSALAAATNGAAHAAALNLEVGRLQAERDFPGIFQLPERAFCRVSLALALSKSRSHSFIRPFEAALRNPAVQR